MQGRIRNIDDGTVYYREGGERTTFQGEIEVYPNWVKMGPDLIVPREEVEQIHEF